ncbi:cation-transporting P-type ATPase 13A2, partial [Pancytospora epiphaga]
MVGTPQPSVKFIGKKYMSDFTSVLLYVLTCGILYIVCHLSPQFEIYLKTKDCELAEADCVVVEDQYGNLRIFHLKRYKVSVTPGLQRYVDGKCCRILNTPYGRFIYDYKLGRFVSPNYRPGNTRDFHDIFHATACKSPNDEMLELYEKRIIYGENDLFLPLPSTLNIIKERMVEWIFLWEIFSMVVWISIKYYIYATVVGCLYLFVLIRKIKRDIEHRDEQLANNKRNTVRVMRGGAFCRISEEDVLPGDLIYIDITESFKCDVEILHGSVISDESFLTGETVPIFKCAHSQVYCGSRIIKSMGGVATAEDSTPFQKLVKVKNLLRKGRFTEYKDERQSRSQLDDVAVGIVVGTGKKTKKGNMLKNIMIRRPAFNVFIVQSHSIIKCLLAASIVIMIVLATYLSLYVPPARNFRFAIDLAIAFFSPALYSTLEMGVQYAKEELLKKRISTTDAGRINTAGEVDMVVFDKTGTLTESTVDILCIDTLSERIEEFSQLNEIEQLGISTCHYVMELENQYSGDILDMKMFMFSNSTIINIDEKRYIVPTTTHIYEPICQGEIHSETENPHVFIVSADIGPTNWQPQIEVVKIFDFDSYLKRMSVVVKTAKSKCFLFCKGA